MGAIPAQIASRRDEGTIRTEARVASVTADGAVLDSGEAAAARAVVVATEGPEAARLLEREPHVSQVEAGLEAEGASLLAAPASEARLGEVAALWGGAQAEEIRRAGEKWPQVRVFQASDVVYVLYFDTTGVMRGFTLVAG